MTARTRDRYRAPIRGQRNLANERSASGWHSATAWGPRVDEYSPCRLSSPSCSYETLIALLHLLTIRALAHLGHPWSRRL
ncbi:hypothetical protein C8Q78DRAFT_306502 [Trametes maxima]|nr:hypothetical protein C8Q78DRAFT_306502 [Trametes maxima]